MLRHPGISRYPLSKGPISCKIAFLSLDKLTVFPQLRVLVFKATGHLEILLTSPVLQHCLSPHLTPIVELSEWLGPSVELCRGTTG